MHIFLSVGEPSGDQHAAHLIQELKRRHPGIEVSGFGGPLMQQAGCRLLYRLTDLAVMGFLRVIPLLWQFYRLVREGQRFFAERRPDAVVLIDFPGFNWWIARKAKAAGIPVFYYLPPQLWAWGSWRIHKVRRYVDFVLSGLPFERDWYQQRGISVEYVGHPFFDEVTEASLDRSFFEAWSSGRENGAESLALSRSGRTTRFVGVLPGSRNQEVAKNWPLMLEAMRLVHARHPDVKFLVANYKPAHRERCRAAAAAHCDDLPIEYIVGKTPEVIEIADCCLMVSGSVSLEMLARCTPAVVLYRCSPVTYPLMRLLVRVKSITLPNLIARRQLFPEWVIAYRPRRDIRAMADVLNGWLGDERQRQTVIAEIRQLRDEVAQCGATARAATAILSRVPRHATRAAA